MSVGHDPHADPLSPYWRQKVEEAFSRRPDGRLPPLRCRGLTPREAHWCAAYDRLGLSARAAAKALGVTPSIIWKALRVRREAQGPGA